MKKNYIYISLAFILILFIYTVGWGCPQKAFLGISCPGCGMTRAYLHLLQGDIKGAFCYHPAFWIVPIAAVLLLFRRRFPKLCFQIGMFVIVLIFFIVYFYRMYHHDPIVICDIRQGYIYQFWKAVIVWLCSFM